MCPNSHDPAPSSPASSVAPSDVPPASSLGPPLAGRRVLVVEDEYFLAEDVARALARLGMEVVGPVPTCAEALARLDAGERIDAAVLDINLRGETCYVVADALGARGVPFVFTTGYDRAVVPRVYGHVPHWEKPFDPERLVRALPGLMRGG